MIFKLIASSNNPPLGALITTEVVRSKIQAKIDVSWSNNNKLLQNVQLLDKDGQLVGESNTEVGRYFARTLDLELYGGNGIIERTEVDHWLSIATGPLQCSRSVVEMLTFLDHALAPNTWLVAKKLTIADVYVFDALQSQNISSLEKKYPNVHRWYKHILSLPVVQTALMAITKNKTVICNKVGSTVRKETNNEVKGPRSSGTRKQEGTFIELPGAEIGKVVVRFPPEASGYLHIGHAKAALLNQYYAEAFQGQLIMRFDDTNPAKETVEFENAILEDLEMLEIKPDRFTHTSDYFNIMLEYCERLIKDGKAFVDDTLAQLMKEQRDQRLPSVNRDNSVDKNLKLWEEMKKGSKRGQECCVRAKIDYKSTNGCLRDPTIYRCKAEPHPCTGTKYKVYPTYDFACPIVDSIEGVTHTLRTTEYHDRDVQFYWIIEALDLRSIHIWEYSRLNMTNTVLSKRKLTWFVTEELVDGWDDPRFPTVRGILRRGMTVEGLKQFIIAQGSSRSVVFMEWDKIWAFNKKVIDPIAIRYTALNYGETVPVNVEGVVEGWITAQNHPKDPAKGTKQVRIGPTLFIERVDAETLIEGQNATFINWGNLIIQKVKRKDGVITEVDARINVDDKNYKNTVKLTWLTSAGNGTDNKVNKNDFVPCYAVYFEHIISKPVLGKDEDFKDFIAKNTRREIEMLGETELKRVQKGEIIQLQRKGFFRCDEPYVPASIYSSREQPLILFHIPDGHASSTSTATAGEKITKETAAKEQSKTARASKTTVDEKAKTVSTKSVKGDANNISNEISKQGDKVRQLKTAKADKSTIDQEVKILLSLKNEYKAITGEDWKPSGTANSTDKKAESKSNSSKAVAQNEQSKAAKTDKTTVGEDVKADANNISNEISKQGDKVRQLKTAKADKNIIDQEVKVLLSLKNEYKAATGKDWKPPESTNSDKKKVESNSKKADKVSKKPNKIANEEPVRDAESSKTGTRLGLEAKKSENLADWYSQVITKGEMIEYYDVSGCYILRPWSFTIWDIIKDYVDKEIKKLGVQNCYFPIFVSRSVLEKEKTHVADFAPEVAWVTKSGESDLAEPIAIRPTSETVMYPAYAKWLKSHRDLPLKLNQWNNVVRWEFKHPQPFLRTREFLWQEGHSAFATKAEAEEEVSTILELYAKVYENFLAVPVVRGRKTEKEKFAGGDYTTTVEAFISASGRAIQGATSHHLGQNFSKMFDIQVEGVEEGEKIFVYQNSWGMTTRTIGVMIMVHGDDKGLVLPPRVASIQVIIVPCGITASTTSEQRQHLLSECIKLEEELNEGNIIRVKGDYRDNYSPGWKFNHWELKGVPLRLELGPKDLKNNQLTLVRRDDYTKLTVPRAEAFSYISNLLEEIQSSMLARARTSLKEHIIRTNDWNEFCSQLDRKNLILAPFCEEIPCEDRIKADSVRSDVGEEPGAPSMGAKSLCIPFDQPESSMPLNSLKCIHPNCANKPKSYTLFGRSY